MMDVVLIGNSQPAVVIGEPDENGNVRVAVFGGEQYVPKGDLYAVGGGAQPFADKADAQSVTSNSGQSNVTFENNMPGGEPQPPNAPGA